MSGRLVLLFDDEPAERGLVRRVLLEHLGECEFREPINQDELAGVLTGPEPALVVTDYRMFWTDGLEVLATVKACWPECPVIMFTGTGDEAVAVAGMKLGLADYVLKASPHRARLGSAASLAVANAIVKQELRATQEELRQAQKLEAFGLLASGVAHDFNNIISVVLGYSQLLLGSGRLCAEDREVLQQVHDAGKRAANLTRQLLAFSRKQVLQIKPSDMNTLVDDLAKMLQRIIGEDVVLQTNLSPGLPRVLVDVSMVEQVLVNLAVNARDAMHDGGSLMIGTSLRLVDDAQAAAHGVPAGSFVILTVADTGAGMSPDVREHLFEPFFTTKSPGKGTGIGLSTIRNIMKQHHGWIDVDSEVGAGTIFTAYFPAQEAAQPEDRASAEAAVPAASAGKPVARILLAEDDGAVRDLVVQILRIHGYEVVVAETGIEAARRWTEIEGKVDMLLTDIVMPGGLNGRDLAVRLRLDRPSLPVVFMSGYAKDVAGAAIHVQNEGRLIQKPFSMDELVTAVREALAGIRPQA